LGEPPELKLCWSVSGIKREVLLRDALRESLRELLRGSSMIGTGKCLSEVAELTAVGNSSSYSGILKGTLPLLMVIPPGLLGEVPGLPFREPPVSLKLTIAMARWGSLPWLPVLGINGRTPSVIDGETGVDMKLLSLLGLTPAGPLALFDGFSLFDC